jgi:hypothetical protein
LYNETAINKYKGKITVKKLLSVIVLILFASISILSGCELISLNEFKYYNTVVMTVGSEEITKEELIQRFNSIGAQYVEDGYSVEEAMQIVVDSIINRELVLVKAKEVVGELTQAQVNDIWQEVYDSVNEQLNEFEGQIKAEWNVVYLQEEEQEEEETFDTYSPYEKEVIIVEDEFVRVPEDEPAVEEPIGDFVRENFNTGIDEEASGVTYDEIQAEAWKRYIRNLKNAEEWKNLSKIDEEVFDRELARLYDIFEGNKYIALLEENFNDNLEIDNTAIVNKYIELIQDSFAKYSIDMDAYHSAMGEDSKNVYYHPNSGEEYVYVSHVLIEYSDEQKEQIENLDAQLEAGDIDPITYDNEIEIIRSQIAAIARDDEGKEVGEPILASAILAEIQNALAVAGNDLELKAQIFNDFIYKYNMDPGMFNAEVPYVINLDTEVEDKMVKPFADTSRELFLEGEGSLSELVATDFGYHIIYYSKPVENLIDYNSLLSITPEALYNAPLSMGLNKSVYDKMYETVNKRSYDNYQTAIINEMKGITEITIYESRYKELLK